jgi:dihydroxyacid dehydratase/phosphogluconate dehydratase
MDARTDITANIRARAPGRHLTGAPARAPDRAFDRGIACGAPDGAEIFKKTRYSADSRRGGRYVAKELFEVAGIPFLTTTLPRHGSLRGDGMIVTGRTAAENLKPVQSNPNNAETISYADA